MRYVTLALVCSLFLASSAAAQTPVPANVPLTLEWTHSGVDVTAFQCYVDSKPSGTTLPATARTCPIPAFSVGAHTVAVEAVNTNAFGTARTKSPDLAVTAGTPPPAPAPPSGLQIYELKTAIGIRLPDGTVEILRASVTRVDP